MTDAEKRSTMDPSGFVVLADKVPSVVQEIRYHSTYNFIGERINGYEEPVALITKEAARALLAVSKAVNEEQYENRMLLQSAMVRNGFEPIDCEWWHFTLKDEPYPDTYFEFPVSSEYLKR